MNSFSYYGMNKNLFQKEISCNDIYESDEVKEGLARLQYLTEVKGIGVIIGEAGVGKTTLLRLYKSRLKKELYNIIYVTLVTNGKFEFLNLICKELGISVGDCYITSIKKNIQKEIMKQKNVYGKDTIIIIDNAHLITTELFKEMAFLYEFEMDDKDYTSIILCGLYELKDELKKSVNISLRQRIICKYEMEPLSRSEVHNYIKTRLERSNQNINIFNANALNALSNASHGVIRTLNSLINISLLIGFQERKKEIDEEIVRLSVEENKI